MNKPKILIVDDKVENLLALEQLLVNLEVDIIRALSGNEAIAKSLEFDFAIALMDVQMPGMDGFETLELLRKNKKTENLPVIFISAIYKEEYYKIKGIEHGAVDFITKPIVHSLLIGKIQVFLNLYRQRIQLSNTVTERDKALEEISNYRDHLEELVLERTKELKIANKGLNQEITERKKMQEDLKNLNIVLQAIRKTNHLIVKEKDPLNLLQGTCNNLTETRGYRNTWIVLFDSSGKLTRYAESGMGEDFLTLVNEFKKGRLSCCCKAALKTKGAILIDETCTDCPIAKKYGELKGVTIRLDHNKKVYGVMTSCSPGITEISIEEQSLLEELAGDLAFALHTIEIEQNHKKAEQALQESERNYRALIENAFDGITINDIEGNYLYANPQAAKISGYSIDELLKSNVKNLTPSGIYQTIKQRIKERIREKKDPGYYVGELVHKSGKIIPIDLMAAITMWKGRHAEMIFFRDITERKETEEAILKSQYQLKEAQRLAQLGNWELDLITNTLTWSDEQFKIFDIDIKKFGATYEAFLDIIHPDDREMVNQAYTESIKTKKPYNIIHRLLMKDGAIKYVNEKCETFYDNNENPLRSVGTTLDITERKLAENAILDSERKLKDAQKIAQLGNWELDLITNELTWSDEIYRIFEIDPEKFGASYEVFLNAIHPEDRETVNKAYTDSLENRTAYEIVHRLLFDDGKIKYVIENCQNYYDKKGNPIRSLGTVQDITESKKAEIKLAKACETALIAERAANAGSWSWDIKINKVSWSENQCSIHGILAEDFDGSLENTTRFIHPEDIERVQKETQKMITEKTPREFDYRIITPDGITKSVLSKNRLILDEEGNLTSIVGMVQDISDRKIIENELHERTKLLTWLNEATAQLSNLHNEDDILRKVSKLPFDITNAMISSLAVHDKGYYKVKYINSSGATIKMLTKILGRKPEGIKFKLDNEAYKQLISGEVVYHKTILDVSEIKVPKVIIKRLIRVAGLGTAYMFPLLYENDLIGICTLTLPKGEILKDEVIDTIKSFMNQAAIVYQRNIKEINLENLSKELSLLLETANAPIFEVDVKGMITGWNQMMEMLSLFTKSEVIGKNLINNYITRDYRKSLQKVIYNALKGKGTSNFELPLFTHDKRKIILLLNANARRDVNGKIIGVLCVSQDITEIDRLHTALKAEKSSLAKRIEERTSELSAVNAELAKASRSKDEFLASMSHELRTPLNAILGLSEALQERVYGDLTEKQERSLKNIEESGRHLLELINEILDLAKIESGNISLEYNNISIESICFSSLRFVKQQAYKKQIKVISSIDASTDTLYADEKRVRQILVNLLSNAVKFTSEGGQIGLDVKVSEDFQEISFSVWDTGIGIPKEHLEKLFQPFIQIDSKLSRQYEGTGLGLALVRNLTEMHNGSVTVETKAGKGSRFTVTLPMFSKDVTSDIKENGKVYNEIPLPIKNEDTHAIADESKKLVLLAEDNENSIFTITEYLKIKGFKVLCARNGEEVINLVKDTIPDIILMDIQMPVMDGLETTRNIRSNKNKAISKIPIIALTALAMPEDEEKCFLAGANEYIKKPVRLKELVSTITELVN